MAQSRWASAAGDGDGDDRGRRYAAQFAALAAAGADVHGEASLCASLVPPSSRVLDAGCGTGRVAIRLAELGYDCVGVDNDASMLAVARNASADVAWVLRDLADLGDLDGTGQQFDLVVAAGNVIPLLAPGTESAVVAGLAGQLVPGGLLVAGFGLDPAHLPIPQAPFDLPDFDGWCAAAGLALDARFSTWSCDRFDGGGYAVTVTRRVR